MDGRLTTLASAAARSADTAAAEEGERGLLSIEALGIGRLGSAHISNYDRCGRLTVMVSTESFDADKEEDGSTLGGSGEELGDA
jgi:hypothetical protein